MDGESVSCAFAVGPAFLTQAIMALPPWRLPRACRGA